MAMHVEAVAIVLCNSLLSDSGLLNNFVCIVR